VAVIVTVLRRIGWAGLLAASGLVLPLAHARADGPAPAIDPGRMLGHIRELASDAFEGRAPGTAGEDSTVAYLTGQFRAMGLAPGNPDGTYVQDVPLVGFTTEAKGTLRVGATAIPLDSPEAWSPVSRRPQDEVTVAGSEVVFVGYGVEAPEQGWDDFKGLDVRGKTLVMLVGDPPVPDPADPSRLDPKVFGGRAMTYYGRWTYKYEMASKRGAAAVLLVHEAGPAGYPWSVPRANYGREHFDIPGPELAGRVAVESWIAFDTARALFGAANRDFDALKAAAATRDFRPVPLGATFDATARNARREVKSRNVVARVVGSDPALRDEHVVFTAHWDHLGRDKALAGDQIYNGAADNASGTAMLLELARAFAGTRPAPKRSLLFLAVTAEEQGLLGATYYAANPLYPIAKTVANVNMDVVNLWGPTSDVTSVGMGQSTLDDLLVAVAGAKGRTVVPDPEPEKGMYYRSDHFAFAQVGVPALNAKGGSRFVGKPEGYGQARRDEYTKNDYHKPSDEVKPDWDLAGAAADAGLLYEVALRVANGEHVPEWTPTSEFRARREAQRR
jgi:Zn-dependent M28 family amino/carboxypeptidase